MSENQIEDRVDDFLEHFGVKGMKWGTRKDRQRNRSLNRASRQKDREKQKSDVEAARERFKSGQARKDYLNAKSEMKAKRAEIGSREARKILREAKNKNLQDYYKSQEFKDNGERVKAVLLVAGATVLFSAIAGASS